MSEPFRPQSGSSNQSSQNDNVWMHCSACRKDIPFQSIYFACSVSTCNQARTRLVFCSVACWDSHLSTVRHRESWAVEERAPSRTEWLASRSDGGAPAHRSEAPTSPLRANTVAPPPRAPTTIATSASSVGTSATATASASATSSSSVSHAPVTLSNAFEREILIVVSKMKKYIKDRSGMNTSDAVAEALGDHVRAVCDQAIHAAAADGRKTVLDRDVPHINRR